jgi:thiol-disulfide isomerase/thioredoxin
MAQELNQYRRDFLRMTAKTIAASQLGMIVSHSSQLSIEGDLPTFKELAQNGHVETARIPDFVSRHERALCAFKGASGWLNSEPLTKTALRGKVVLLDFWTYSCINWRRTLPSVRAWAEKYKSHGLVVVGVHTPEFDFERDINNVRQAVKAMKIGYPVALNSEYAIWRAFDNQYWPALHIADSNGPIRPHKFGEGDYDQLEPAIQLSLIKAGATDAGGELLSVVGAEAEVAADWDNLRSAENYLGYERTQNFASAGGLTPRKAKEYVSPTRLKLNHWALGGNWAAEKQSVVLKAPNGRPVYQFHARDLHLVMGPLAQSVSVRFRVLMDGKPPAAAAQGADVNEKGEGCVTEPQMYQLIRQRSPILDRRFEIEFLDPGVAAFSFTFG